MHPRIAGLSSLAAGSCLSLLVGLGCQRTVEGLQQDTREASENARQGADDAKTKLNQELGEFKTQADAKLQEL
jgi:hypothetical protein